MTETQQSLQTRRAALLAERAELEHTVAEAKAVWERYHQTRGAHPNYDSDEYRRATEASATMSEVGGRVNSITDQVAMIDKRLAFLESGTGAPAEIRAAKKALEAIEAETAKLGGQRAQVAAKLALLRETAEQAAALASAAEQAASQAYASAVADGDDKAQQAAMEAIERAQVDLSEAHRKASGQAGVVQALEAELAKLDEQRATLAERAEEEKAALYGAIVRKCRFEWDQATEALETAGARLMAASSLAGYYAPLRELNVPRHAPGTADLGQRQLLRLAEGLQLPELDAGLKQTLSTLAGIRQALSALLGRG